MLEGRHALTSLFGLVARGPSRDPLRGAGANRVWPSANHTVGENVA